MEAAFSQSAHHGVPREEEDRGERLGLRIRRCLNKGPEAKPDKIQKRQTKGLISPFRSDRSSMSRPWFHQAQPMFFTRSRQPLWLGNIYRGRSAFLIGGGPSLGSLDLQPLGRPGILTMGMNNSVKTFRPNLWVGLDSPDHFLRSIWLDSKIMKFAPFERGEEFVFDSDLWAYTDIRVEDCPNVVYFHRNDQFQADRFLWEGTVNWGNRKELGGGRSVMLAALRILIILGIRRIYLLGIDFRMSAGWTYHFNQKRSYNSIQGNNQTYQKLNQRFAQLRPYLEELGAEIYNCNPASRLDVFDFMSYEDALQNCGRELQVLDTARERTEDLYDESHTKNAPVNGKTKPTIAGRAQASAPWCVANWQQARFVEGVIVGVIEQQQDLLPFFIKNYFTHNSMPLLWVDFGVSISHRLLLEATGRVISFHENERMGWLRKPFAILHAPFQRFIWLGLDVEVKTDLKRYFKLNESAQLMAGLDGYNPASFRRSLPDAAKLWDSGMLIVRHGGRLIQDWAALILDESNGFRGDHEALSLAIFRNPDGFHEIPHEMHAMRMDPRNDDRPGGQWTFHWSGPAGKDHIRSQMHLNANPKLGWPLSELDTRLGWTLK